MKIDLHGYTVHSAWQHFRQQTQLCYLNDLRSVVVVTGHGAMSTEFERWCEADPYVTHCTRLDPNTGAWRVFLIKKPKKSNTVSQPPSNILDLSRLFRKFNSRS